uniref:Uncharacterized protein n=1 Tax=Sinocyclocheilus rhinocerous TaxID=307959 RepID=A0A673GFG7_9TELE
MENITDGKWERLPVKLHDSILQTLRELKFAYMTPVQVLIFRLTVLACFLSYCINSFFPLNFSLPVSLFL